jgi:AhpD family alkylhydroperoxidase
MDDRTYHHPTDRQFARTLRHAAPQEFQAYQAFSQAVMGRTDGAIPQKTRELIALGVALTTQCAYCLETHTAAAVKLGASKEELAEVVYIASAMRAGAAAAHGMLAMKLFETAVKA